MIRDVEGNLFGPATMETLVKWARDGRLAAEQELSEDGESWTPVDAFPELAMDWAAELAPGKFFGPVNRDAMREFMRSGDISEEVAKFVRVKSIDESPSDLKAENDGLRAQLEQLRSDFTERTSKMEAELSAATAEKLRVAGELSTRDLDFEAERQAISAERSSIAAERQSLAAEKSKLKAELAKAEKHAALLAAQVADNEAMKRSHAADMARIAELEKKLEDATGEVTKLKADIETQAADARRRIKDAEIAALAEKREMEAKLKEAQAAADAVTALRKRDDAARRLASQLASLLAADAESAEIVDAEIIEGTSDEEVQLS